jgi:high-affinity iron transporter
MFATALIVFREVLEAALIIGIVLAASRGIPHRGLMVSGGITMGLIGAIVVAAAAGAIADAASGMGQEILNACILGLAVLMLGWHNIWMSRHGREIAHHMRTVGRNVARGSAPVWMLGTVIALAVLREGSEVVLFLYGVAAGGTDSGQMLVGGGAGLAAGAMIGALLYFGLLGIPMRYFFAVTSGVILLVAAGLASQAAGMLLQAGLLPPLGDPLWDTSSLVSDGSIFGKLLQALVGYSARPAGIQVLSYIVTLLVIGGLMKFIGRMPSTTGSHAVTGLGVAAMAAMLGVSMPRDVPAAPFKVYSPNVVKGENEIEYRGFRDFDDDSSRDGAEKHKLGVGRGFTDSWFSEIYSIYEKEPGGSYEHEAIEWENRFQLTEQGKYWADFGLLVEYEATRHDNPDELVIAPIIEKAFDRWVGTINLFFEREVGSGREDGTTFAYAARLKYLLHPNFEPAIEAFGEPGKFNHWGTFNGQEHWAGPAVYGAASLGGTRKLVYSAAYLFGETSVSSDARAILRLEYEFF